MKRLHKFLAPVLAVGAALAVAPATGCAGEAYVVETAPPPPRSEVVHYRPGYFWVNGYWERVGRYWRWQGGYYVRERPNYVYVQPRWERRGNTYVYIRGEWRPRAKVIVRRPPTY